MKNIRYSVFGLLLLTIGALWISKASAADSIAQQIVDANNVVQVATKNYDDATLKKLITADYELIGSSGAVYNRGAFLADIVDRSAKWEINSPEDVTVRQYNDDCAILVAVLHIRYRVAQKVVDARVRYTDVWVKLNGQWRYASGQATSLK